jgi:ribosomal protein S27AE
MLVRSEPETAPLCPQCGDAMRLARKLPQVRPLSGLVVHLCGRCGYVGTREREPEPPPPKWLQPKRGSRYSLFRATSRQRQ